MEAPIGVVSCLENSEQVEISGEGSTPSVSAENTNKKRFGCYMLLQEILNNYKPVYPEGYNWDITLDFMLTDPTESKIVYSLVATLMKGESFRRPVVLYNPDDGPSVEDDGEEEPHVADGTHRICAHIIAGVEEVYVKNYLHSSDNANEDADEEDLESSLETKILLASTEKEEEFDNIFEEIFTELRSLELSDDLWIVADVVSMQGNVISLSWDSSRLDDLTKTLITSEVEVRLAEMNFLNEGFSVTTEVFCWDALL